MWKSKAALAALLLGASPALADELDATRAGQIQAEVDMKQDAIKKEYEGRKLSGEERKERDARLRGAASEVFEQNGTNAKDFDRATSHLGRNAKDMEESRKATKEKAKADAEKPAEKKADKKGSVETVDGIVVEKGTDAAKEPGADGESPADGPGNGPPGEVPQKSKGSHRRD